MKKKTSRPLLTAGTSTLLLIFLSLCLLTFAVLSLLSARADRNLSRKTADRTTAYYEACNQAENRIGEIDGILEKIWKNTEGEEMYFQEIEIHFEDAENSESETGNSIYSWDSASRTLSFSVPLADTQVLAVSLTPPLSRGRRHFLHRHHLENREHRRLDAGHPPERLCTDRNRRERN